MITESSFSHWINISGELRIISTRIYIPFDLHTVYDTGNFCERILCQLPQQFSHHTPSHTERHSITSQPLGGKCENVKHKNLWRQPRLLFHMKKLLLFSLKLNVFIACQKCFAWQYYFIINTYEVLDGDLVNCSDYFPILSYVCILLVKCMFTFDDVE